MINLHIKFLLGEKQPNCLLHVNDYRLEVDGRMICFGVAYECAMLGAQQNPKSENFSRVREIILGGVFRTAGRGRDLIRCCGARFTNSVEFTFRRSEMARVRTSVFGFTRSMSKASFDVGDSHESVVQQELVSHVLREMEDFCRKRDQVTRKTDFLASSASCDSVHSRCTQRDDSTLNNFSSRGAVSDIKPSARFLRSCTLGTHGELVQSAPVEIKRRVTSTKPSIA
ncbi:hypothetical protein F5141DRAFT_211193 [Pisolithus sp. B1]|nr:hypothetical protein F5141DRAFT_211193 [Pisolithus sp. B1]